MAAINEIHIPRHRILNILSAAAFLKHFFKRREIFGLGLDDHRPKRRYLVNEDTVIGDLSHHRQRRPKLFDKVLCLPRFSLKYIADYEHTIPPYLSVLACELRQ